MFLIRPGSDRLVIRLCVSILPRISLPCWYLAIMIDLERELIFGRYSTRGVQGLYTGIPLRLGALESKAVVANEFTGLFVLLQLV